MKNIKYENERISEWYIDVNDKRGHNKREPSRFLTCHILEILEEVRQYIDLNKLAADDNEKEFLMKWFVSKILLKLKKEVEAILEKHDLNEDYGLTISYFIHFLDKENVALWPLEDEPVVSDQEFKDYLSELYVDTSEDKFVQFLSFIDKDRFNKQIEDEFISLLSL